MNNVSMIVEDNMCCGCGACSSICPKKGCIEFIEGKYVNFPKVNNDKCIECGLCMKVCPGNMNIKRLVNYEKVDISSNIKEIKVSYSTDDDIRKYSASGGIVTQIIKSMFESENIDAAVIVSQSVNDVLKNTVQIIEDVNKLKVSQGSRYSPASNCTSLREIINNDKYKKIAFVGKPCDIEAVAAFEKLNKKLLEKIRVKICIMCHHSPTRKGVMNILKDEKIDVKEIKSIKFRGNGWPGEFQIIKRDGQTVSKSYFDAWNNYLSKDENSKCIYCENPFPLEADFIVGDPWGEEYRSDIKGRSLVIIRSENGISIMKNMEDKKQVISAEASYFDVERYQKNLLKRHNEFELNALLYRKVRGYKINRLEYIKLVKRDYKNILRYVRRLGTHKEFYKEWKYE